MANTHSNLTSLFTDIANAIREKTGGTEPIVADNFSAAIKEMKTGGTSVAGTLAHSHNFEMLMGWYIFPTIHKRLS